MNNIVEIKIHTVGIIFKEVYVTVKAGCETSYSYGTASLVNRLKYLGVGTTDILKILMKIRKKENKILFKRCSFFELSNKLLNCKLVQWS